MRYIVIENDGEAEELGMRLMGASTKSSEQIGRFGTGWKYGKAGVLRLAGPFDIYLGTQLIRVDSVPVTLRGQEHQEITLNGQGIGITDQLGKDWEPWMVLREFISNAIDEGGAAIYLSDEPKGEPGKTRVCVPSEPFAEVYENLDDHFCIHPVPGEVITELWRAIPKSDPNVTRIFKKGVLVKRVNRVSAFDYELRDVPLGEDRVTGDVRESLWAFLDQAPMEVKRAAIHHHFEGESFQWRTPSAGWKEAFDGKLVVAGATGNPDEMVVPWQWAEVAELVGARTMSSDLAAKAAKLETMPATISVREACKKLAKVGIELDPRVVLMAKLEGDDVLVEKGITYVSKDLSEEGLFEALLIAATQSEGSKAQVKKLAAMVRRLARLR